MSNPLLPAKHAPALCVHHHPHISLHNLGWLAHMGVGQTATLTHIQDRVLLAGKHDETLSPFEGAANTLDWARGLVEARH